MNQPNYCGDRQISIDEKYNFGDDEARFPDEATLMLSFSSGAMAQLTKLITSSSKVRQ